MPNHPNKKIFVVFVSVSLFVAMFIYHSLVFVCSVVSSFYSLVVVFVFSVTVAT